MRITMTPTPASSVAVVGTADGKTLAVRCSQVSTEPPEAMTASAATGRSTRAAITAEAASQARPSAATKARAGRGARSAALTACLSAFRHA
jgi:hypothetical protein